jgi:hypothetical protein
LIIKVISSADLDKLNLFLVERATAWSSSRKFREVYWRKSNQIGKNREIRSFRCQLFLFSFCEK